MKKRLLGYYVRATYKVAPHRGKTLGCSTHDVYQTREDAEKNLPEPREADRYTYDVAEVWIGDSDKTRG